MEIEFSLLVIMPKRGLLTKTSLNDLRAEFKKNSSKISLNK